MTMPQAILMISFGTLIIQPVTSQSLKQTVFVAIILSATVVIVEYLQLKFNAMETLFSGKSVTVIQDGKIIVGNLRQLRLTVDRLETRLKQQGITSAKDVQIATIEVSGELGYVLKPEKQPATKEDVQLLMQEIEQVKKTKSNPPSNKQ